MRIDIKKKKRGEILAMLSKERILKIDIFTPDNTKILSLTNKQFLLQEAASSSDTMLLIKGRGLPEIPRNTPLEVITSVKSGERIKYGSFVTVSTDNQLNILVKTDDSRVMEERRRYYKIEADIDCIVNFIDRGEERITFDKPMIAKIKDLNIGGIFLCSCKSELQKNDVLMLTIMLDSNMVNICAEILRVQKNAAGDITGYGCRFINLSPSIEEIFAKYVFRLQLEKLKEK